MNVTLTAGFSTTNLANKRKYLFIYKFYVYNSKQRQQNYRYYYSIITVTLPLMVLVQILILIPIISVDGINGFLSLMLELKYTSPRRGDKHIQVWTFEPATTLPICHSGVGILSQGNIDTSLTTTVSSLQTNDLVCRLTFDPEKLLSFQIIQLYIVYAGD